MDGEAEMPVILLTMVIFALLINMAATIRIGDLLEDLKLELEERENNNE